MLKLKVATKFKKDLKRFKYDETILDKLENIIELLINGKKLPEKNRDHDLIGNYKAHRECHISPDLLLIYKIDSVISLVSF